MKKSSSCASCKGSRTKTAKTLSLYSVLKLIRLSTAEDFEALLTQGLISSINMRNGRGETLLMFHCMNKCLSGVKLLIEHGADVNITDGRGNSALILACRHYKDDAKEECASIIQRLVAKGADMNIACSFLSPIRGYQYGTAFFEALITNRIEVLRLLLELGVRTDAVHQNPLVEACTMRNMAVIRLLLSHGADVNIIDNGCRTCMSIACEHGYDDLAELLLDHGADMDAKTGRYGQTPFLLACINVHLSTVKLLLDRGADANLTGDAIPLIAVCQYRYMARHKSDLDLIDLLLEYGADINAESDGLCALGEANRCYRREVIIHLLERGADLYKEDGVTPIAYITHGLFTTDPEIIALFEKNCESNKRAYRALQPLLK